MLPHLVVLGTVLDLENFTDAVVNDPGRHDQKCLKILKEWLCVNPGSTWTLFCEKLKHAKVFSNLRSTIQRDKLFATGQEGKFTSLLFNLLYSSQTLCFPTKHKPFC